MSDRTEKAILAGLVVCKLLWNATFVFVAVVLWSNARANNDVPGWDWTKDPIEHWIAIGVALLLLNATMSRRAA